MLLAQTKSPLTAYTLESLTKNDAANSNTRIAFTEKLNILPDNRIRSILLSVHPQIDLIWAGLPMSCATKGSPPTKMGATLTGNTHLGDNVLPEFKLCKLMSTGSHFPYHKEGGK